MGLIPDGFFENIAPGLAAGASAYLGHDMAKDLKDTGVAAQKQMGQLAGQLRDDTAFRGYGVQTGLGNSTVNADGSTNLGVGPDGNMLRGGATNMNNASAGLATAGAGLQNNNQMGNAISGLGQAQQMAQANSSNQAYGQAMGISQGALSGLAGQQSSNLAASEQAMQQAMMDGSGREQEIYNRAMAMQQPQLDAQRAQQQAREYAMGRGGVRGSQFGGTAEDAATARAQAGAMNQASFQSMAQGQQEMMNQANMSNMFGQSGMGAATLQNNIGQGMGQLGAQNAQLGQSAANMFGQFANQKGQLGAQQAQQAAQNAQIKSSIAQAQGALGMQMNQNAYTPMDKQLAAMQVGQGNAGMAQSGQFTGAGYGSQLAVGGIQADINAQKAASELYGNMFGAIMDNAGAIGKGLDGIF